MTPKLVSTATATIIDFGVVESGIRERETHDVSRGLAFAKLVTETVFCVATPEIDEHIVDGGADRGIDIVYIDHNNKVINIGSCKTVIDFKNSKKFFPADEIDKIISFVDDILLRRDEIVDKCNGKLSAKIREIWEIFDTEAYSVSVHLFSNRSTLTKDAKERLSSALARHGVSLFEYGLYELSHGIVKSIKPRFKKSLRASDSKAYTNNNEHARSIVLTTSLVDIAAFLSTETGSFDERLIWQNVRYFLGVENEVNREIKSTLLSENIEDFWFLNSGITIVCDQILSNPNGYHSIHMVNPQIVNGCQTASVIQAVSVETMRDLRGGQISVRIIETSDPSFVERIARASNTQSRILSRDLRAHDTFQLQLAECLRNYGYFYRRSVERFANTKGYANWTQLESGS